MEPLSLDSEWAQILQFFPEDLDRVARATGAVKRWRNVKSGEELLRLILAYVVCDFSLRTTAGWATQNDLAKLKDTSVLHRLRRSVGFLEVVLAHLLNQRVHAEQTPGVTFRIKDATVLSIPGSKGTDWRIHATYDPVGARLVRVEVTDYHGGERLDRDSYTPGEVVIADRGLARAQGLHAVAQAKAFSLLRMHWQNIRLADPAGQPLDLEDVLRRADQSITGTEVHVPLKDHPDLPARLIVRPYPHAKAEEARRQLRRNARKKGRTPSEKALRLAGYFCLLTTLPASVADDATILELYRVRWQIELFFKRDKSLLHLDHLRADDPLLVRAYCTAKLIEIALVNLLADEGEAFSPWGTPRSRRPAALSLAPHPPL